MLKSVAVAILSLSVVSIYSIKSNIYKHRPTAVSAEVHHKFSNPHLKRQLKGLVLNPETSTKPRQKLPSKTSSTRQVEATSYLQIGSPQHQEDELSEEAAQIIDPMASRWDPEFSGPRGKVVYRKKSSPETINCLEFYCQDLIPTEAKVLGIVFHTDAPSEDLTFKRGHFLRRTPFLYVNP